MSKWTKIIKDDKSTYPEYYKRVLLKCSIEESEKDAVHFEGAYCKDGCFVDWCGDIDYSEGWEVIAWCEIPTDEKCKFKYCIEDGGFYLSSCSMSDHDKTDADYFIYCPRCGKEIEFV